MPALDDDGGAPDIGLKEASARPVDRGPALPSLTGGASYEGLNPTRPEEAKKAIPVGLIIAGTAVVIAGLIVGAVLLNRSASNKANVIVKNENDYPPDTSATPVPAPTNSDSSISRPTPPPPPPSIEEMLAVDEPDYVPWKEQMTKLGAELNEYLKQSDGLYPEGIQQLASVRKLEMPVVMGGARCPCRVVDTMADLFKGPFIINDRIFKDRSGNRRQLMIDTAGKMFSLDPGEVDRRAHLAGSGREGFPVIGMRRAKYGDLPGPYFHWPVRPESEPIDQARVRMRNLQGIILAYADAHKGSLPAATDVLAASPLGFDKDDLHSSHAPDLPLTMTTPAVSMCRQLVAFDPVPYSFAGQSKYLAISLDSLYVIEEPNFAEALNRDTVPIQQFVRRPIDQNDSPRVKAEKNLWNVRCMLQAYASKHQGELPLTLAELKGSGLVIDPAELSPPGRPNEIYGYVPGYNFRSPHASVVLYDPGTFEVGKVKVTIGATMAQDLLYSSSLAVMRQTIRTQVAADKTRSKENVAVVQWSMLPRATALPPTHPLNDLCDDVRMLENRGRIAYVGVTFGPPATTSGDAAFLNWKTLQDKRFANAMSNPAIAPTNWFSSGGWCLSLQTTVSFGRSAAYWLYSSEWEEDGVTREAYFNLLGGAVAPPDFKERPHKFLEAPTPSAMARMAWELLPDGAAPDSCPLKRMCTVTKALVRGKQEAGWIGVTFGNRAKSIEDPPFRNLAVSHERQFKEMMAKENGGGHGQMILLERNGSMFKGLRYSDLANSKVISFVAGVQDGYAVVYWYIGKYVEMAEQSVVGGAPSPGSK